MIEGQAIAVDYRLRNIAEPGKESNYHSLARHLGGLPDSAYPHIPGPMLRLLIAGSQKRLRVPPVVIGLETDASELLSLVGTSRPFVAYTTRFLEFSYLTALLLTSKDMEQDRASLSRILFSEIIADRLLRQGHIAPALQVYLESWRGERRRLRSLDLLPDLDSGRHTIAALGAMGYSLCHELGHFVAPEDDGSIRGTIEEGAANALAAAFSGDDYWGGGVDPDRKTRILSAAEADANSPLNAAFIAQEVAADMFAFDTLVFVSTRVFDVAEGDRLDLVHRVAQALVVQSLVLHLQKYCDRAVWFFGLQRSGEAATTDYLFEDAALLIRLNFMAVAFPGLLAPLHFADSDESLAESLREAMRRKIDDVKPAFNEVEAVVLSILGEFLNDANAEIDMSANRLESSLGLAAGLAVSRPEFRLHARRFCSMSNEGSLELVALANLLS